MIYLGGANLGPEAALSNLGGGIATYVTEMDYFKDLFEENDKKLIILYQP